MLSKNEEEKDGEIEITVGTKEDDIIECSFHSWGPNFSTIPYSLPFSMIPLEEDFLSYLQQDKIKFPKTVDPIYGSDDAPSFPEIEKLVSNFFEHNKGGVFVKMNWSAPKDCKWVFFEPDLKCKTLKDVWILLKSSDFISHDIERLPKLRKYLVLKQWINIDFSMEFRCFVKENKLMGICQRDVSKYFPFLKTMKKEILSSIMNFWEKYLMKTFPLNNYTFDVFWDVKDSRVKDKIILLDFNVFGEPTHPLLFYDWQYFSREEEEECVVKVIESRIDQNSNPNPIMGLPVDVNDPETFQEMQKEFDKFEKMGK